MVETGRFTEYKAYQKDDCRSWTVFALPHKSKQDVEFPDADHAQELHFRLSTYFQELDLPLEKMPSVSLEWLEAAQNLKLSGNDAGDFGDYLNAVGVLYGNIKAGKSAKSETESRISSYMQIISSYENKLGVTKVAHRVPYSYLDDDIYDESSDYINALTRTALIAVISKQLDRASGLSNRPDNHDRLQRIRDYIIAERKNFPNKADQSRVEKSNFRVLNQFSELVDETILQAQGHDKGQHIMAEIDN